ncbi:MAG: SCP2 sterol-binding domain-containing protein [Luteimonas sp.]
MNAPTPFAWKPIAGRTLEAALNRALALDPETRAALLPLDGRSIELTLDTPPLALQLRVEGERLSVGPADPSHEPDLAVRSTLAGMLSQLAPLFGNVSARDAAPAVGRMRVSGDADLARHLQRLAERFDPDWQQPFAAVFGDVLGVQIAQAVAGALKGMRGTATALAESAAEYVTEESRDVLGRDELNAFHDAVDAVRDDVERLAVRVSRLNPGAAA